MFTSPKRIVATTAATCGVVALVLACSTGEAHEPEILEPAPPEPTVTAEPTAPREPSFRDLKRLGWSHFDDAREGDVDAVHRSIEAFEAAAELEPDRYLGYEIGMAHMTLIAYLSREPGESGSSRIELAERAIRALESDPEQLEEDPSAYATHGMSLAILGILKSDPELIRKGVEGMDASVERYPDAVHTHLTRGFTLMNLPPPIGDRAKVIGDLEHVANAISGRTYEQARGVLHVLLGDLRVMNGDTERGREDYDRARRLESTGAEVALERLEALDYDRPDLGAMQSFQQTVVDCAACHASYESLSTH